MQRRHLALALALIATLLAVYLDPPVEKSVVGAVSRPAAVHSAPPATSPGPTERAASFKAVIPLLVRERISEDEAQLFATQSWDAPKATVITEATVEPSTPPPTVPPVPIQLMGRYQEGSKTLLFALYNKQSVVLKTGENLGAEWRVDTVDSSQVVLTHLPSGQKQSLPWGTAP